MLLYHYTDINNFDSIRANGLHFHENNSDTLLINEELKKISHQNSFDRNQCIFFLPYKPKCDEHQIIIEIDSETLHQNKLYAANYYYADVIWSRKRYLPDHYKDIIEASQNYLDSFSLLSETDLDFNEENDEIEILYFDNIPSNLITNIYNIKE